MGILNRRLRSGRTCNSVPASDRGGDGETVEGAAIERRADADLEETAVEFAGLTHVCGRLNGDWLHPGHSRVEDHELDICAFELRLADGTPHRVSFVCTESSGKLLPPGDHAGELKR